MPWFGLSKPLLVSIGFKSRLGRLKGMSIVGRTALALVDQRHMPMVD